MYRFLRPVAVLILSPLILTAAVAFSSDQDSTSLPPKPSIPATMPSPRKWQDESVCGANCVYALIRLLGHQAQHTEILDQVSRTEKGSTLAELQRVSGFWGVTTEAVSVLPEDLASLPTPCIVHVSQPGKVTGHFMVFCGETPHGYAMIDGTTGAYQVIDKGLFLRSFSGNALVPRRSKYAFLLLGIAVGLYILAACFGAVALVRRARVPRSPAARAVPRP
jgi:hypothetical protein